MRESCAKNWAGGHRGSWVCDARLATLVLLREVRGAVHLPLVATGGLMTRQDVQAALSAGASLAALGTAFLLADEAGTHPTYRQALEGGGETGLTRAFTGRWARGLVNRAFHEIRHPLPTPAQHAL
ncbi:nitronate monooxygenase, partial [Deinococcus ficus]